MRKPIAKIRIAAGNPGWYDSLTNIHLTIARPTAFVYEGQNVTNVKNAIRHRIVSLIEGDLEPISSEIKETPEVEEVRDVIETPVVKEQQQQPKKQKVVKKETVKEEVVKQEEQPKQEEVKEQQQEVKAEEVVKEEVVEEQQEKKTTRKKAAKKTESAE